MKDSTGSAAAVALEAAMIAGDACGKVQAASAQSSEASFVLCAVYLEEVRGQATLAEAEAKRPNCPLSLYSASLRKLCLSHGPAASTRASGASGGGGVGSAQRAVRQRLPAAGLVARGAAAGLVTRGAAAGLGTWRAGLRSTGDGAITGGGAAHPHSAPLLPRLARRSGWGATWPAAGSAPTPPPGSRPLRRGWGPRPPSRPPPHRVAAVPQASAPAAAAPAATDEVRTLWIGDLQYWMDENYVFGRFANTREVQNVKLIRDKNSGQLQGYGFVEFTSRAAAERVLQTYNGQMMPNVELTFRLNWASAGEKRDDTPDYTIFVGDFAADVTDYLLQETFRVHYPSVKGAKVVTDKLTTRTKGYGFVKFGDPTEQARAMTEMNGMPCSSRPMRIGRPASRKNTGGVVQERASTCLLIDAIEDTFNLLCRAGAAYGPEPSPSRARARANARGATTGPTCRLVRAHVGARLALAYACSSPHHRKDGHGGALLHGSSGMADDFLSCSDSLPLERSARL
ncbi:uncharacterized protein [Miscanthus floridulus]|uniref:uncharacterized protein n=1 Tax=Miscanthus floridulus TaxID=154761 RepID=UPI003458E8AC